MFIVTLMVGTLQAKESVLKKNPDIINFNRSFKTRSDYMDIIKKGVDSIKLMLSRYTY